MFRCELLVVIGIIALYIFDWTSPQKVTDHGNLPVYAGDQEWTNQSWYHGWYYPHSNHGYVDSSGQSTPPLPKQAGSRGGNVGYQDSSVTWQAIDFLTQHYRTPYTSGWR